MMRKSNCSTIQSVDYKKYNAITLIALVITIIILLILAGISTVVLIQSGLLQKAEIAASRTDRSAIIEKLRIDIFEKQTNKLGTLSENDLKEILEKYGELLGDQDFILDKTLKTKDGKHEIKVSEIWNGKLETEVKMHKFTISYNGDTEELSFELGDKWDFDFITKVMRIQR